MPLRKMKPPSSFVGAPEMVEQHVVGLAAALCHSGGGTGNLLPRPYQSLRLKKRILSVSIAALLLFSAVGVGSIAFSLSRISSSKQRIEGLRKEIAEKGSLVSEYERLHGELQKVQPLIDSMNKARSSPDVQRALAALASVPTECVRIRSIRISPKENDLIINLQGVLITGSFTEMDKQYRDLIHRVGAAEGVEILSQGLDLKNMAFSIEARWKT